MICTKYSKHWICFFLHTSICVCFKKYIHNSNWQFFHFMTGMMLKCITETLISFSFYTYNYKKDTLKYYFRILFSKIVEFFSTAKSARSSKSVEKEGWKHIKRHQFFSYLLQIFDKEYVADKLMKTASYKPERFIRLRQISSRFHES